VKSTVEIISTGTELLRGMYADTNAPLLSRRLLELGLQPRFHTAVPDDAEALEAALRTAFTRVDLIVITGGLGPTADDVTRQVLARVCGRRLVADQKALRLLEERFRRRGVEMSASNVIQAEIPEGAVPLYNEHGTATGFVVPGEGTAPPIIALPGPKREILPMLDADVVGYLKQTFGELPRLRSRTIRTIGVPESLVNERLRHLFSLDPRATIGLLCKPGQVDIRIDVETKSDEEAETVLCAFQRLIEERVERADIFGYDDETLEQAVGRMLIEKALHIAVAESCTGGLVTMRLTEVSGSSNYITECYIAYSDEAKEKILGVDSETLQRYGAVSAECAGEMASGVRRISSADIGVSVTGIAGPTGGTAEKPVGRVFFGLATSEGVKTFKQQYLGNRSENRWWASDFALDMVRRYVLQSLSARGGDTQGTSERK
jgi:nicotinamide-nucleotide amidase